MIPSSQLRDRLVRWRRRTAETLGCARYSWPGLNGLDRILAERLDFRGGFFVEAGANDGFAQSNTYYLERFRGWSGVLVEPIPELARRCRRERRKSTVVQAALVEPGFPASEIEMSFAGLMSVSAGAFADEEKRRRHLEVGLKQHGVDGTYVVRVPARTLSGIIDEAASGRPIDLLSLDVEGAEVAALAGLDLARHAPRMILVEARPEAREVIRQRLAGRYGEPTLLFDAGSHEDWLFERR